MCCCDTAGAKHHHGGICITFCPPGHGHGTKGTDSAECCKAPEGESGQSANACCGPFTVHVSMCHPKGDCCESPSQGEDDK